MLANCIQIGALVVEGGPVAADRARLEFVGACVEPVLQEVMAHLALTLAISEIEAGVLSAVVVAIDVAIQVESDLQGFEAIVEVGPRRP